MYIRALIRDLDVTERLGIGLCLAVGVDAGLLLFELSRVPCWTIFLALLATMRGGTSFLCPTATKKRSKENALQPLILKCPQRAIPRVLARI